MPEVLKVLGQARLNAPSTDLVSVPVGKSHVISSVLICNWGVADAAILIYVRIAGAGKVGSQCILSRTLEAGETFTLQVGLSLGALDVLTIDNSTYLTTSVSATACGVEVS